MTDASVTPEQATSTAPPSGSGKFPFYAGIAGNRLYFHKTPREKLDAILSNGLSQPMHGGNPLARRISYASDKRYSGGSGYILGFKPEQGEIPETPPQFSREVAISPSLPVLPPERNVFSLPGVSQLPWQLFESVSHIIDDYYAANFNTDMLANSLRDLLAMTKTHLHMEAQLKNADDLDTLSQEIVWNEFCAATARKFDGLSFHTGEIVDIRSRHRQMTYDDFLQQLRSETVVDDFQREAFENDARLLSTIHTVEGLGFEGHPYPVDERIKDAVAWVKSLPDELPVQTEKQGQGGLSGLLKKLGLK